ncbi:MAG: hypothetical protein JW965_06370 [Bacteroidales bacterium]|nr:hypothetical protein [Bacteroidales bacterium]
MAKKGKTKKGKVTEKVKKEARKVKKNAEAKIEESKKKVSEVKEESKKKVAEMKEELRKKAAEVKEEFKTSVEDIKENLRKAGESVPEASFWEETGDNISEGAKIAGEEARNTADKISAYSEVLFGRIKDRSAEAFKSGLDLTREGVNKAQALADKLRDNIEVSRLNREKKEIATRLGMKFYLEVKNNNNTVPENMLGKRVFMSLIKELEDIDKQILDLENE